MKRTLVFDRSFGWTRMMLTEDGVPLELRVQAPGEEGSGTVYLGRVTRVVPRLSAAFVDVGTERNAFLPLRDGDRLKGGSMLPVQAVSLQTSESKGMRVRRGVQLAGRTAVYLPEGGRKGCSGRIADPEERRRLLSLAEEALLPGEGVILRTAAAGEDGTEIQSEIGRLRTQWEEILRHAETMRAPGVLYEDDWAVRMTDARASQEIAEIITNDDGIASRLLARQADGVMDPNIRIIRFREDKQLLCDTTGLGGAILQAEKRKQYLPGGGFLVVDECEAMTVYDVNSGGARGSDPECSALAVNLEAARAAAAHMRLAGCGGIIAIDFIDMTREEDRDEVLKEMRRCLKDDPAASSAFPIGPLGVMQVSRKREGHSLMRALRAPCGACGGRGLAPSPERLALDRLLALRRKECAGSDACASYVCTKEEAAALQTMADDAWRVACEETGGKVRVTVGRPAMVAQPCGNHK